MRKIDITNDSKLLCKKLESIKKIKIEDPIVLSISKEAVPLGEIICKRFDFQQLNILFNRPIISEKNPECIIAVSNILKEVEIYEMLIEAFSIKKSYIHKMITKNMVDLTNEYNKLGYKLNSSIFKNRDVILIDNALSTGASIYLSIKTAKKFGAKRVIVMTILTSSHVQKEIKNEVDVLLYCKKIEHFVDKEFYKMEKK